MADNTTLNAGSGGDVIVTEQPGGAGPKIPVSKIYTGAADVNGGPVTLVNPLPVELSDGTFALGSPTHPVRTDPIGATVQPVSGAVAVSGTVAVSNTGFAVVGNVEVTNDVGNPLPVSATALPLPAGASTAANQATAQTSLSAIATALAGTLTAALAAGTALIGAVASALRTDSIMNGTTSLTPKFATVNLAATGQLVALVAGKKLRVLRYSLMADAACSVYLKSHTAGQISGTKYIAANGGAGGSFSPVGHFETVAGEALDVNITGAANVSVDIAYIEV
jgi:hypothetical protein